MMTTSRKPSLVTLLASVAVPITYVIWIKPFGCLQIHTKQASNPYCI